MCLPRATDAENVRTSRRKLSLEYSTIDALWIVQLISSKGLVVAPNDDTAVADLVTRLSETRLDSNAKVAT